MFSDTDSGSSQFSDSKSGPFMFPYTKSGYYKFSDNSMIFILKRIDLDLDLVKKVN